MTKPNPFVAAAALLSLIMALALTSCITCERCARKRAAAEAAAAGGTNLQTPSPAQAATAPPAGQAAW